MRKCFSFAFFLLFMQFLFGETDVVIYKYHDNSFYGIAFDRSSVISVDSGRFLESTTLPANGGEGFLTAVILDSFAAETLDSLFNYSGKVIVDGCEILKREQEGRVVYQYYDTIREISLSFSLEKPGEELLKLINYVYKKNSYWGKEVEKHYRENYVIRMHAAENVLNTADMRITFDEALLCATIIGDSEQWLWGIHDGKGIFNEIGLAALRIKNGLHKEYDHYRDYSENDMKMYNLIKRIEGMSGYFVQNLYDTASAMIKYNASDDITVLPEQLIETGKGGSFDLALFYYDVLRRKGFEVILIAVEPFGGEPRVQPAVLYRAADSYMWGCINMDLLMPEIDNDWVSVPAVFFNNDVSFIRIDENHIFKTGETGITEESPRYNSAL